MRIALLWNGLRLEARAFLAKPLLLGEQVVHLSFLNLPAEFGGTWPVSRAGELQKTNLSSYEPLTPLTLSPVGGRNSVEDRND